MSDQADRHGVLYWNRATPELYAVLREQAPPELEPVFIETEDPAEARAKLARAEFVIIADWALTAADLEGAPRLRGILGLDEHGLELGRRLLADDRVELGRGAVPVEDPVAVGMIGHRR